MGTAVIRAFSLSCAFQAKRFLAGSLALNWFGAADEANGALLLLMNIGCWQLIHISFCDYIKCRALRALINFTLIFFELLLDFA